MGTERLDWLCREADHAGAREASVKDNPCVASVLSTFFVPVTPTPRDPPIPLHVDDIRSSCQQLLDDTRFALPRLSFDARIRPVKPRNPADGQTTADAH